MPRAKYHHTHIYTRLNSKLAWKCEVPNCPHIIKGTTELMVGKRAECPYCHQTFYITQEQLRRKIIHCGKCSMRGKLIMDAPVVTQTEEDIFTDILKENNIR